MLLDEPLRQLLLGRSLNFCSCTTWLLDFDDSVRINRAWLYKDLKVQAIASVAHQGACWTWNLKAWALFPLGVTFYCWTFWFSHSKDENATIGISLRMWKTLLEHSPLSLSLLLPLTIPAFHQSQLGKIPVHTTFKKLATNKKYNLHPCLFSFIGNLPDLYKHGKYDNTYVASRNIVR